MLPYNFVIVKNLAGWLGWGILATCGVLSAAMTVMLVVFIWLALHVAARFDMAAA